jgi:hypothetical protein
MDLRVTDFHVKLSSKNSIEMREEFGLEDAMEKRVRFLSTHDDGEPVVLQIGSADVLDSTDRDRTFRPNRQLIVHDTLLDNVDVPAGLGNS